MYFATAFLLVTSFCIGLVVTDIIGSVPYQSTCDPNGNGTCSSERLCQCATVNTGEAVCTQQMSCQHAAECDANGSCAKNGTVCVIDNRCPGLRLCYSTILFSPELCPASNPVNADA